MVALPMNGAIGCGSPRKGTSKSNAAGPSPADEGGSTEDALSPSAEASPAAKPGVAARASSAAAARHWWPRKAQPMAAVAASPRTSRRLGS
eukprot:scaffold4145_cov115-Isochrysis_galbana.AAC.13